MSGTNVLVSSISPRTDDVIRQQRVEELNTILQDVSAKVGVTYISNDRSFRLADGQPNSGYLCKDGLHINSRGTYRFIDNLRQAKLPTEDSKPAGNNEGQAVSSKRKRRHDNDNNDRGNTNNNTINDGRGDDDAKTQHARNNNNNNNDCTHRRRGRIGNASVALNRALHV